ncbi:MAG: hypothetical protein KGP10_03100 [Actinomycetales bacterium]|nr:hypothetical protein [Actinomycetales bacterium]
MNRRTFDTRAATRGLLGPLTLIGLAGCALVVTGWVLIGRLSWPEAGGDRFVVLIPALLVVGLALGALFSAPPTRIALLATAIVLIARYTGPLLIDRLPGSPAGEFLWVAADAAVPRPWLVAILTGSDPLQFLARDGLLISLLLLGVAGIWGAAALGPLITARRPPASMGIDVTLLVAVFAAIAVLAWRPVTSALALGDPLGFAAPGSLDAPLSVTPFGEVTATGLWLIVRTLSWAIPVVAWTALACRQGGAIAVGTAAGLVTVTGLLPWLLARTDALVGNVRAAVTLDGPSAVVREVTADRVLDPFPTPVALTVVSVALLVVVLVWVSSPPLIIHADRPTATAASPLNGTAVAAFILAWLPPTAIPGIVLGHVAYDNIASTLGAQRGAGLARAAILIGYASLGVALWWLWTRGFGR